MRLKDNTIAQSESDYILNRAGNSISISNSLMIFFGNLAMIFMGYLFICGALCFFVNDDKTRRVIIMLMLALEWTSQVHPGFIRYSYNLGLMNDASV